MFKRFFKKPGNLIRKRFARKETPADNNEVMEYLKKKLSTPGFFSKLELAGEPSFTEVKKLEWKGRKLAIKFAERQEHGADYDGIRRIFLAHQRAVRKGEIKPKKYKISSIKVFGKIGNYIVMKYIEGISSAKLYEKQEKGSLEALEEMFENFRFLRKNKKISKIPQIEVDFIAKPSNPEKGKWEFFLPYDYE